MGFAMTEAILLVWVVSYTPVNTPLAWFTLKIQRIFFKIIYEGLTTPTF
jgi:hypothetical protein